MHGKKKGKRNAQRTTYSRTAFMCARHDPMDASGRRLWSGDEGTALSGTSLPIRPLMNSTRILLRAACRTMPSRRSDRDGKLTTNIFSNCRGGSHLRSTSHRPCDVRQTKQSDGKREKREQPDAKRRKSNSHQACYFGYRP